MPDVEIMESDTEEPIRDSNDQENIAEIEEGDAEEKEEDDDNNNNDDDETLDVVEEEEEQEEEQEEPTVEPWEEVLKETFTTATCVKFQWDKVEHSFIYNGEGDENRPDSPSNSECYLTRDDSEPEVTFMTRWYDWRDSCNMEFTDNLRKRCLCGILHPHHPGDTYIYKYHDFSSLELRSDPTDSYGRIMFLDDDGLTANGARYFRASVQSSPVWIAKFIKDYWLDYCDETNKIDLFMVFIGDAFQFTPTKLQRLSIKNTICEYASQMNVLCVTDGLEGGWLTFLRSVREELLSIDLYQRVDVFSIVPYSKIASPEIFENSRRPPGAPVVLGDYPNVYGVHRRLDPGCDKYLFLDDGCRYGRTTETYAYRLSCIISYLAKFLETNAIAIAEAGSVEKVIEISNFMYSGIPVLLLKNDTCATEMITQYYSLSADDRFFDGTHADNVIPQYVLDRQCTPPMQELLIKSCKELSQKRKYLRFIDLNEEKLPQVIEETITKHHETDINLVRTLIKLRNATQLKVALSSVKAESNKDLLNEGMTFALLQGDPEMVDQLISETVDLKTYLNLDRLQFLYAWLYRRSEFRRIVLRFKVIRGSSYETFNELDVNEITTCIRDLNTPYPSSFTLKHVNMLMRTITGKFGCKFYDEASRVDERESLSRRLFYGPAQELFLWSVFNLNKEMATCFWDRCDDRLFLAIMATCIYRRISSVLSDTDQKIKEITQSLADDFETLAVNLLAKCSLICPDFKWNVYWLTKETWQCSTLNNLAILGNCRQFLGTVEMQDYVFGCWTNNLNCPTGLLLLAVLIPPLIASDKIVYMEKFEVKTEDEIRFEKIDPSQITRKVGMDYEVHAKPTYCEKFRRVYNSVRVKYLMRLVFYIPVLLFATYVIFFDMVPGYYSISEAVLLAILLSQFLDVITSIVQVKAKFGSALKYVLSNFAILWFEMILAVPFVVCVLMRVGAPESMFVYTKSAAAILLMLLYLRVFMFFRIHPTLGTFLTILGRMSIATITFMIILVVVILPSGIAQEALLYPNRSDVLETFKGIFFYDYYRLFGELALERSRGEQDGCEANSTDPTCPTYNAFVPLVMAAYMLIANIFLMNVLIAVYSNIITEIQEKANEYWKYNFLMEMTQYQFRWLMPPPLNLLEVFVRVVDQFVWWASNKSLFVHPEEQRQASHLKSWFKNMGADDDNAEDDLIDYGMDVERDQRADDDDPDDDDLLIFSEWRQEEDAEVIRHAYQAVQHLALKALKDEERERSENSQFAKGQKLDADIVTSISAAQQVMEAISSHEAAISKMREQQKQKQLQKDEDKAQDDEKGNLLKELSMDKPSEKEPPPRPEVLLQQIKQLSDDIDCFLRDGVMTLLQLY